MTDWGAHFDEWSRLVHEEREIRSTLRGSDELSRCCQAQTRVVSRAATELPAAGSVFLWVERALLEADVDGPENLFTRLVLRRRGLFPRRYLRPYVRAAMRPGMTRAAETMMEAASAAYGREAVLREMVDAAKDGLLEYTHMRQLLYEVRDAKWSKLPPRRGIEHDLEKELIDITSGGTVTWHRERPEDD